MDILLPESTEPDIYDFGFDQFLNRDSEAEIDSPLIYDIQDSTQVQELQFGSMIAKGPIQSSTFTLGGSGWKIDERGIAQLGALRWNKFVLMSYFESLDGWNTSVGTGGTLTSKLGGASIEAGATASNKASLTNVPQVASVLDFSKNTIFQVRARLDSAGGTAYISLGDSSTEGNSNYIGFHLVGATPKAVSSAGTAQTSTTITGITTTNWNNYAFEQSGGKVTYYVNGTQVAEHSSNVPSGTLNRIIHLIMQNDAVAGRILYLGNILFAQDF